MKVLILGAGGAAANGFTRALRAAGGYTLLGANCDPLDLELAETDQRYLLPSASNFYTYRDALFRLYLRQVPDFIHAQPDVEVEALGRMRSLLGMSGVRYMLPSQRVIEVCQDKWESHQVWKKAGLPQPETWLVRGRGDLYDFIMAGNREAWLRARNGAGGFGAIKTDAYDLAVAWLRRYDGWGKFTIAEVLTPRTVTWTSVWKNGQLCLSQQRRRCSWANARNSPSGVSGSTGVGETCSDPDAEDVGERAVRAIDPTPHGIYSVDMAYDHADLPNPTEINVGRFFTTVPEFFAKAGFNIAHEYVQLATGADVTPTRNPLPDGLKWVRGMDTRPALV